MRVKTVNLRCIFLRFGKVFSFGENLRYPLLLYIRMEQPKVNQTQTNLQRSASLCFVYKFCLIIFLLHNRRRLR